MRNTIVARLAYVGAAVILMIIAFALIASLPGCAPAVTATYSEPKGVTTVQQTGIVTSNVQRTVDKEAGVVCYFNAYGLSCLPITDTKLK